MKFTRYIPITKADEEKQMVYGWASTPDLDSDGEIIDVKALQKALPNYLQFPTIREMHQPSAVGVTKEANIDSKKGLYIGAKIVDKNAWAKVKEGVYRAFSIGGNVVSKIDNVIDDLELNEISLVDRPANPQATITVFKRNKEVSEYVLPSTSFAIPKQRELPLHTVTAIKASISKFLSKNYEESDIIAKRIKKAMVENNIDTTGFDELVAMPLFERKQRAMLSKYASDNTSVTNVIKFLKEATMADEKTKTEKSEKIAKKSKKSETETKEEEPETPVEPEEAAPEAPKVEVDEAKQTSEKDGDLMKRLEALEEKADKVAKKVKKSKKSLSLQKLESLNASLQKMASILEKFEGRIAKLESTPAAVKTKPVLVDKSFDAADEPIDDKEKTKSLEKLNKRIQEIIKIRETNPGEYASNLELQREAQDLLDERSQLLRK